MSDWIWQAYPGHFMCADRCLFRLNTVVCNGKYIVSTIGDMKIYGMHQDSEEVGSGRLYETMVFEAKKCGCDERCDLYLKSGDGIEVDFDGYNEHWEASRGHVEMCKKWDNGEDK